jgi:hypothetical protein
MNLGNLKIGTRLGSGFFGVLVLLAAIAGLGLNAMSGVQQRLADIVDGNNVKNFAANEMVDNFRDIALIVSTIVLLEDPAAMQDQKTRLTAAREKYGKAKKVLVESSLDAKEKELLDRLDQSIKAASPLVNKVVELGTQNRNAEATALMMSESAPATRSAVKIAQTVAVRRPDQPHRSQHQRRNRPTAAALKDMNDSLVGIVGRCAAAPTPSPRLRARSRRQPGLVFAHRTAGRLAGRDGRVDGRTDLDRQAERRQRPPGESMARMSASSVAVARRQRGRRKWSAPWARSTRPRQDR